MVVDRVMAKAVDNYLQKRQHDDVFVFCSYKSAENFFQLSNFEPITSILTALPRQLFCFSGFVFAIISWKQHGDRLLSKQILNIDSLDLDLF